MPFTLHDEGFDDYVCLRCSGLDAGPADLAEWEGLVNRVASATKAVRVGIIGKYVSLPDAYLSAVEALKHRGYYHGAKVEIEWIQAEEVQGLLVDGRLRRPRRHRDPRRVRRAGVRGQDGRRLRPREPHPVPGASRLDRR